MRRARRALGTGVARRPFLTLLLIAAVALGSAYLLRDRLASAALDLALRDSGLELLELHGLAFGRGSLAIGRLVIGMGAGKAPQTLEGLRLRYSLPGGGPAALSVARATLTPPTGGDDDTGGAVRIGDLVSLLFAVPLDSFSVGTLSISGPVTPLLRQPLTAAAEWRSGQFLLRLQDRAARLELRLQGALATGLRASVELAAGREQLMALALDLEPDAAREQLRVQGRGRLAVEPLLRLLDPLVRMPAPVTAARGQLPFELAALLDDTPSMTAPQRGSVSLLPSATLELTLAAAGEPLPAAVVDVSFPQGLTLSLEPSGTGGLVPQLESDEIVFDAQGDRGAVHPRGRLSALQCRFMRPAQCGAALEAGVEIPALVIGGGEPLALTGLDSRVKATLALAGKSLTVAWAPGELLRAERLRRGDTRLHQVALVADSPGQIEYQLAAGVLGVQANRLQLLLPRVDVLEQRLATRLALSDISLTRNAGAALEASAKLGTQGINLQRPGDWSPALALQSEIALSGGQLRAEGRLYSERQRGLLDFAVDHDLAAGRGRGFIRTVGVVFDSGERRLSRYFSRWPYSWDLYQGELSLEAELDWQRAGEETGIRAALAQRWHDLAGVYGDIGFVGCSGHISGTFRAPDQFTTTEDASLRIAQLEVGVPVESIRSRFSLDTSRRQVTVRELEARLFGGRVWTSDAVYLADRDYNRIDIGVEGLQLEQLLARAGYDAVEATGTLGGLLPLDIGAAGVTMERGMLAARAPGGVFRYRGAVAPDANPAVAQALAALSHYHYTVFQTEADYLPSGDLELRMVLRGHNPDLAQARPIHLNLNVSDNIPKLLKSLKSGREIAEIVRRRLGGEE